MAQFPGNWGEPVVTGPKILEIDGRIFSVPEDAKVKIVYTSIGKVGHVRDGRVVHVLSARGQLVEPIEESRRRAVENHWSAIAG